MRHRAISDAIKSIRKIPAFILFLGSFAANFIALAAVPLSDAKEFYGLYAISNTVFSLVFTVLFSTSAFENYRKVSMLITVLVASVFSLMIFGKNALWLIYPLMLLVGDYSVSQAGSEDDNFNFRILLILSATLFIIPYIQFYVAIILRIGIVSLFYLKISLSNKRYENLKIKSPLYFLIAVYICYSGSQMLIPSLNASSEKIKFWYLASQIGLGLLLKRADFLSRTVSLNSSYVSFVSVGGALLPPMFGVIFFPDYRFILIYVFSSVGIFYATKLFQNTNHDK